MSSSAIIYPHFRGLRWADEAGLVSQKPVMSPPQSVTTLCVLSLYELSSLSPKVHSGA